jgi:hypothetical protein
MNRITLENELAELEQIHRKLDENISRSYTNYLDDADLSKMKQEKLQIKREIEKIKAKLNDPFFNILR